MSLPTIADLTTLPANDHPDLLADPVAAALIGWPDAAAVGVVAIDAELADTAALVAAYDLPLAASGNCVLVAGQRAGDERIAACVVPADTRADVNGLVRRLLDVRKASFLPMERAVEESAMEYGGITPVGLPAAWRVLVDERLTRAEFVVLGSGVRRSKLLVPGPALGTLPGVEVIEDLGR
ncbi:YbaK/EbsC family protein [Nocardioides lacus]|uniref:YbaK/EbsC family protein n=1 Tax=Nocardioides sp. BP30 TaxID=3036374 RepID=UPI0032AFC18F